MVHRTTLPPELRARVTSFLRTSAGAAPAAFDEQHLATVTERVLVHTRTSGMTVESMVIGLREAYDSVIATRDIEEAALRNVYDELLRRCLDAYFATGVTPDQTHSTK